MHLNTIRLEGNYENDHFFDRADSLGILVMTGWVCCDAWEEWNKWEPEHARVAAASLRDQIRRLRSHPSVLRVAERQRQSAAGGRRAACTSTSIKRRDWPNPYVSSASAKQTTVTGDERREDDRTLRLGAAQLLAAGQHARRRVGFNTETSPGRGGAADREPRAHAAARDHLWPIDERVELSTPAADSSRTISDDSTTRSTTRYGAADERRGLRASRRSS